MEGQTQEVLSSILGDEFKVEVEKRDRIIKQLNTVKESREAEIATLNKELEVLNAKKAGLQDEIAGAYAKKDADLKTAQDNFEISKTNSISALEKREKDLENKEALHEASIKTHQDNVHLLNKEKSEFETKKKDIAEALAEAGNAHSELFKDAVDALNSSEPVVAPVD